MKLTVVVPVLGQHDLANLCINMALKNKVLESTKVVVIDNGQDYVPVDRDVYVDRPAKNLGVYPLFKYAFEEITGDVLLTIHSDLLIGEKGYDKRISEAFENDFKLGLLGFIGSNEIDGSGGRGLGTTSNFLGLRWISGITAVDSHMWQGSPAHVHGKHDIGLSNAAVVDGCAMAIRRSAWDDIEFREKFPPHHFYDRLISTQMLDAGFHVAVLGIGCDHISGQTVAHEDRYYKLAEEWARANIPEDRWAGNPGQWSWDQTLYQEAERMWLSEYRDAKHLVPIRV
jgi:glycosyltransferase involved in cell wall biosynthesis